MKIRWKYVWLGLFFFILTANLLSAYINTLSEGPSLIYSFETRHAEFGYLVDPDNGPDMAMMEREFQKFLSLNPQTQDRELYRTFEIKPWKFWNWYHFLTSDLYRYPYKEKATSE